MVRIRLPCSPPFIKYTDIFISTHEKNGYLAIVVNQKKGEKWDFSRFSSNANKWASEEVKFVFVTESNRECGRDKRAFDAELWRKSEKASNALMMACLVSVEQGNGGTEIVSVWTVQSGADTVECNHAGTSLGAQAEQRDSWGFKVNHVGLARFGV